MTEEDNLGNSFGGVAIMLERWNADTLGTPGHPWPLEGLVGGPAAPTIVPT